MNTPLHSEPGSADQIDAALARRLAAAGTVGSGLVRPECVLANAHGSLYTADWRGGVAHIRPDGSQALYAGPGPDGLELKPNGVALLRDGSFLVTHLGAEEGLGRFWVTVSTRQVPRALGYRRTCHDGFIVRVDGRGAAIVADGLGYTNEVAIDPSGQWLYVNETFGRRLSRFALRADGSLGHKQVVTEFGPGTFPDGLALDVEGHAWVVSIVSNRLIRVAPGGAQEVWLEDADAAHLARVERAFDAGTMGRAELDGIQSRRLRNISSIAFTGPDRRRAALGCLLGDRLVTLDMPVAGLAPTHWSFP
jgi:hypothetical protein